MYSRRVIDKVLDDFEMKNGWRPEEHSSEQIKEFNDYISSIIEIRANERSRTIYLKDGLRLTIDKQRRIRKWIQNEQFMCFADARYFLTRYAYICNEAGDIFKFKPRKAQEVFLDFLDPFDEMQVAIELFVLKARQQGISTAVVLLFLQRILFIPFTQAVQASVDEDTSQLLARIFQTCWDRLPFWLPPPQISTKQSAPKWANGSIISIQSGKQAMGIAQGWTPTCIHISELADIPKPQKVLEEGLFRATHSTRKLFMVLEGTGGGSDTWQAKKWKYYKENEDKGGRFAPRFIPWPCCPDLYPATDWLRKHPIPEAWEPIYETKRMMRKAELFIRSTHYLAKVMGSNWKMPREQQWFWEANYREAQATGTLKTWLSQMPISDEEALQSKHDRVFSDEVIEIVTKNREKEFQAYAVTGQSVLVGQTDTPYYPGDTAIDWEKPRIPVSWKCKDGHRVEWELIPLRKCDETEDTQLFNRLLIFEEPREGCDYSIGIDTADGLGKPDEDRTVASVTLNRYGNQRDEQVAEFVSHEVNPPQMVSIAACLAAYYGQWRGDSPQTKDPRGVKFCIEQRTRPGDDCQFQLKLMGFNYHHVPVRYDKKELDLNSGGSHGWFTNAWSRPILLNRFTDAVTNGWYKPNSPMLIRQLRNWVRKTKESGKTQFDHESGQHDDNIFAAAMSYFTRHAPDVLVNRQQEKYASLDTEDNPPISFEHIENTITI